MVCNTCKERKERKVLQGMCKVFMSADLWLDIYEQWEADPDPGHDEAWVEQLAGVAILHGLPCYENGVDDAGAAGWRRLVARYEGGEKGKEETRDTEYKAPRLPWAVAAG